ncbi:MAG: hypothetical protein HGA80_02085 [Candidatus Omnitrophica bacterium]|nr:hypothetical protein [Candidatus Omnitrophota bacterium]
MAKTTHWCDQAGDLLCRIFPGEVLRVQGGLGDPLPESVRAWSGEILISFLSPWIVPPELLQVASRYALNFHPGPPEYPGIGCYNFALYDGVTEYGVTAHHMAAKVDTGNIVAVSYFAVDPAETVWTLKEKSMRHMLDLLGKVAVDISAGNIDNSPALAWKRKPYTRRELNDLCRIDLSMDRDEVARRVRATTFPGAQGAWLEFQGYRFEYVSESQK